MEQDPNTIAYRERLELIKKNRYMGFDALAKLCNISKSQVKDIWNDANMGFKHIPRTLPKLAKGLSRDYILDDDIVIFLDPITPVLIPRGFKTDLGSVPSVLMSFIQKDDVRFLVPFILHDVMYLMQWQTRAVADAYLHMNAKRIGAPLLLNSPVYFTLTLAGWLAWHRNKKQTEYRKRVMALVRQATADYHKKHGSIFASIDVISE